MNERGVEEVIISGGKDGTDAVPAIELRDVVMEFDHPSGARHTALNHVSMSIEPGEIACLLGPSGHGKSTLLNLIAGFLTPTSGSVSTFGKEVSGPGADRGVIFQRDTLFNWKRVSDNVEYGLKARGLPKRERAEIVNRYLDIVGLKSFAHAWPRQLSGGMRRRAAIATVFANEPDVLLMDEPFVGLDYARRMGLYEVLIQLWKRSESTVFFVTHDVDEALTLASRIFLIVDGRIAHEARLTSERPRGAETLLSEEANEVRRVVFEELEQAVHGVS